VVTPSSALASEDTLISHQWPLTFTSTVHLNEASLTTWTPLVLCSRQASR